MKKSCLFVFACGVLLLLGAVRPSFAQVGEHDITLGGVNLTAYCTGAFGGGFKSIALGPGAGDWVCQNGNDVHDRRPISVQTACAQQYRQYANVVKARSGAGAGSWVCVVRYWEYSVNLTAWCTRHFGNDFRAVLIGTTSGDWVCQRTGNAYDRRPISVLQACQEQYPRVYKALAVPPSGWVCLTDPF